MSSEPLTIESPKEQEDACVLPSFDSDVAWELGTLIQRARRDANSSQLFFFVATRPGTLPDNMHWIKRKEAVVLRWGDVLAVHAAASEGGTSRSRSKPSLRWRIRACMGVMGFPVREDDHGVIVDGIREYLARHDN
ncbi:hypothetical protein V8E55_010595 [Tylopilus felleus]